MDHRYWVAFLLASAVVIVAPFAAWQRPARAIDTAFTYQGQLKQAGTPVNGQCDVQFSLFDAAMDGALLGTPQLFDGLSIADGVFTVLLDFGPVFDGSGRWLEIASRCPAGAGTLTTLVPRQAIWATPYTLGLALPFVSTISSDSEALRITNTGDGPALRLVTPGSLNPSPSALVVESGGFGAVTLSAVSTSQSGGAIRATGVGTGFATVDAKANAAGGGTAVLGEATGMDGVGVRAQANAGTAARALYAQSLNGFAGYFDGKVQVISPASNQPDAFVVSVELDHVARIDSAGKGFFNGGTQMGGADVAEFVLTTDAPGPGDVVEIDADRPGRFRLAATRNSTAVAGVISTDPGVSLNARSAAAAAVEGPQLALVGRVPVKVTADNGSIKPGDLLVASDIPGHAMRSPQNPPPGTVIGKALTAHADGNGVVEMLVMLR